MKKIALLTFFSVFFFATLLYQTATIHAQNITNDTLTIPVTPPITSVARFIRGTVTYKFLGRLNPFQPRVIPAANVTIEATNFFNPSITFSTTTDTNGNYTLLVDPAHYFVKASDTSQTFFVPTVRASNTTHHDQNHVNFQGLIFP